MRRLFLSIALLVVVFAAGQALLGKDEPPVTPTDARYSQIAFVSNRDGNDEVYVMNSDGSNVVNFSQSPWFDTGPKWLPNGSAIAFVSIRGDEDNGIVGSPQLYAMNLDGSDFRALPNTYEYDQVFSPDGHRVAFKTEQTGNAEIFVMGADGSNPVNLTNHRTDDLKPNWSPDGQYITFVSQRDGNLEVYVMGADGSNPVNLTNNEADDMLPVWSPDGRQIAFVSRRDGNEEVYVMNRDGSNPTNLTNNPNSDNWPSWSPDSKQITFMTDRDGNLEVYTMSADGSNPTNLTNNEADDFFPSWSPWLENPVSIPDLPVVSEVITPTTLTCPESPSSRLNVGMQAFVAVPVHQGDVRRNLRVRAEPGGEQVGSLEPGTAFVITGDAVCGDDSLMWWPIKTLDGTLSGWSVEGFAPDDYLMIPKND